MKISPAAIGGTAAVSVGGFLTFRKYAQHRLAAEIMKKYRESPLLLGVALYMAAFNEIPGGEVKVAEVKLAALKIAQKMIPLWGWALPQADEVVAHIQAQAIETIKKDPTALLALGFQEGANVLEELEQQGIL